MLFENTLFRVFKFLVIKCVFLIFFVPKNKKLFLKIITSQNIDSSSGGTQGSRRPDQIQIHFIQIQSGSKDSLAPLCFKAVCSSGVCCNMFQWYLCDLVVLKTKHNMEAPCSTINGINIKILPMFVFSSIKKLNVLIFSIGQKNKNR